MGLLRLRTIPLHLADGSRSEATAEGNNAAWLCPCGQALPLLGRCFPPDNIPETACPNCKRRYSVRAGSDNRPESVNELEHS